jgi:hypothetical protein
MLGATSGVTPSAEPVIDANCGAIGRLAEEISIGFGSCALLTCSVFESTVALIDSDAKGVTGVKLSIAVGVLAFAELCSLSDRTEEGNSLDPHAAIVKQKPIEISPIR